MNYYCAIYSLILFIFYSYILYNIAYASGIEDATYDYEDFTKEEYIAALEQIKND